MSDHLRNRLLTALSASYDVGPEIGRGGMGVVYRALDRKLRRPVAIKVLPPELAYRDDVRVRFLREAQTAAQLSHPHIVPIYAVEECDGLVCFVMALVDGESVGARMVRERRLPIEDVSRILVHVGEALGYAHSRGIVHRDIKPDNILLDRSTGHALVTDFGIARAVEGENRITMTGIAIGTPAYMSPEQATGDKDIDGRSDLYSLAIVGYQMLAGELPFQASNTPAMLMKHIGEQPRPLKDLRADAPPWLLRVLDQAMAKKAIDRFVSAEAFCEAIRTRGAGSQRSADGLGWQHAVPAEAAAARHALPRAEPRAPALPPMPRDATHVAPREAARDAVDAANAGWRARQGLAPVKAERPVPAFMPPGWAETRNQWQSSSRDRGGRVVTRGPSSQASLPERIRKFRGQLGSVGVTVGMLAAINIVTSPEFFWFLFPAAGMSVGLLHRASGLWADGVRMRDVFGKEARERIAAEHETGPLRALPADQASELAPGDVLGGAQGTTVRRAADDLAGIRQAVAQLGKADREMIPDVLPTAEALARRVGSIATSLHRLDEDVRPGVIAELVRRIEQERAREASKERDQKLELLERQHTTLEDLASRRDGLVSQLENASLLLQSMRVDLTALRNAGVQSVLGDTGSPTTEARAISRDIAHVLDAAREIR